MTVLSVSHLSKKYARDLRRALWYGVRDIGRQLLPRAAEPPLRAGEFWALDDVSFDLARGEALAVIGRNGAGKSTLLKLLYGLVKPDRGEVRLHGRLAALIELGTGFHPLLTGRENVQLGAALQGFADRDTEELHRKVIDFAELGEFIDTPVQSYSSGMRARLAFALAAQLEPDVLLVDEVLAVGDFAFQRKCVLQMRQFLDRGGSLLLVSHNTHQVQSVCQRGILLDRGRILYSGTAVEALHQMFEQRLVLQPPASSRDGTADGPIAIDELLAEPLRGDAIRTGEPMRITLRYRAEAPVSVRWGFSIWTGDQWVCVVGENDPRPRQLAAGPGEITCTIPRLPLVGGPYTLRAAILDSETLQPFALVGWGSSAIAFDVRSPVGLTPNAQMSEAQLVTIDVDWE
jgi:ABC-type polysaccharide/polyol phosphate transport system ATPase subunit